MKLDNLFTLDGVVTEPLPNAMFRVELDNGRTAVAHSTGRMRMHKVRILIGDKVQIEVHLFDMTHGTIVGW